MFGRKWILTGNGIVESLLGKVASLVGGVEDLVVENGEVEGEAEADGVGGRKLALGNLGGGLVGDKGLVGRVLALVASSELGKVAVVVTLPGNGQSLVSGELRRKDRAERIMTYILW